MIKSAIQQKTIGVLLREKRREKGMSIEQIAEITKIRAEYLTALENSLYTKFPSEVYLKGFLKNYAKFLGIGSDQALALYRRENVVKQTKKKNDLIEKIKDKSSKIVITPNRLIAVISGVLLISLLVYLSSYFGTILKKPSLRITAPITIDTEGEFSFTTQDETVEIVGQLDTNAKVSINGQEISPATVTTFSKTFNLSSDINAFIIKAVSPFGRESQITLNVTKSNITMATPGVGQISASLEVLNNNISLTVFADGALRFDKVYDKGAVIEFTASEEVVITTNKDSVIMITINGVQEKMTGKSVTYELINGKILKK